MRSDVTATGRSDVADGSEDGRVVLRAAVTVGARTADFSVAVRIDPAGEWQAVMHAASDKLARSIVRQIERDAARKRGGNGTI